MHIWMHLIAFHWQINDIIKDDLTEVPLLLLGEPGTLKTSIIAAAILKIAEQELNSELRYSYLEHFMYYRYCPVSLY